MLVVSDVSIGPKERIVSFSGGNREIGCRLRERV